MTKRCLVTLTTPAGQGFIEVQVNSLHQLAVLMPATVIAYEVEDNGECPRPPIPDTEVFDTLVSVVEDIQASSG